METGKVALSIAWNELGYKCDDAMKQGRDDTNGSLYSQLAPTMVLGMKMVLGLGSAGVANYRPRRIF